MEQKTISPKEQKALDKVKRANAELAKIRRDRKKQLRKEQDHHKFIMGGCVAKYFPDGLSAFDFDEQEMNRIIACAFSLKDVKNLIARLEKLNDASRKDNVVTFEQLGVDRLFVDESHNYKNLFLYTKMRNVAGIAQSEAQKSSDMFAKCQYLDELPVNQPLMFILILLLLKIA